MSISIDSELAGFLYIQNVTTLVGAALGAGPMGKLALVATGTLGETNGSERVVRAAFGGAGLGVAPLGIRHF
jgi:hypothetical protein